MAESFGQRQLIRQAVEKLRTDTEATFGLVALTKHKSSDLRIARDQIPTKPKLPFLGVKCVQSIPLLPGGDVSHVQRARMEFRCYSTEELTTVKIADRMEDLLHHRAESGAAISGGTVNGFYDFSDPSGVSVRSCRWKMRDEPDFDSKTDVWTIVVSADVIWVNQPCPEPA